MFTLLESFFHPFLSVPLFTETEAFVMELLFGSECCWCHTMERSSLGLRISLECDSEFELTTVK